MNEKGYESLFVCMFHHTSHLFIVVINFYQSAQCDFRLLSDWRHREVSWKVFAGSHPQTATLNQKQRQQRAHNSMLMSLTCQVHVSIVSRDLSE